MTACAAATQGSVFARQIWHSIPESLEQATHLLVFSHTAFMHILFFGLATLRLCAADVLGKY